MRGLKTTEPRQWILIEITDPNRKVQSGNTVVEAGATELRGATHLLTFRDAYRREVGIRSTQPAAVSDGNRQNAGD